MTKSELNVTGECAGGYQLMNINWGEGSLRPGSPSCHAGQDGHDGWDESGNGEESGFRILGCALDLVAIEMMAVGR